jgi:hypothetical protein
LFSPTGAFRGWRIPGCGAFVVPWNWQFTQFDYTEEMRRHLMESRWMFDSRDYMLNEPVGPIISFFLPRGEPWDASHW